MNEQILGMDSSNGKDFTCVMVGKWKDGKVVIVGSFDSERKALRFIARNKQHLILVKGS